MGKVSMGDELNTIYYTYNKQALANRQYNGYVHFKTDNFKKLETIHVWHIHISDHKVLFVLTKDIEAGKRDELLSGMTNDKCMDALGVIYESIQAENTNVDVIPYKVSHVDDSTNLNVDKSTMPSDPIVQSVDINTKSISHAGIAGASAKDHQKVNSNFCSLVVDRVFDGVNIFIPCKVVEKVNSEADLVDVVTAGIPSLTGDDFTKETIHVEYEWRPSKCDICKIFGPVHDHCLKKVASPLIVATSNFVTTTVEKKNDGFQMVGKKKKRKDSIEIVATLQACAGSLRREEEDLEIYEEKHD
nr:zinc knuckle CX2CX4HX4C [Tanacetum cinerariifolium]